uniref:Uncharacterized protein n=1 Tax=Lepeophtheirus salmonis TaxID=72036 RepID=A0A0K2UCP9_LEPSM
MQVHISDYYVEKSIQMTMNEMSFQLLTSITSLLLLCNGTQIVPTRVYLFFESKRNCKSPFM